MPFHLDSFLQEGEKSAKSCLLYSGPYVVDDNVYSLSDPTTGERKGKYNIANLKFYHRRT
jgi:hypothetical protein